MGSPITSPPAAFTRCIAAQDASLYQFLIEPPHCRKKFNTGKNAHLTVSGRFDQNHNAHGNLLVLPGTNLPGYCTTIEIHDFRHLLASWVPLSREGSSFRHLVSKCN